MSDPQNVKPRPWWMSMNLVGVLLLSGAFVVSMVRVFSVHQELFDPEVITLRISHWQLEAGYREAMDDVIKRYEELQASKGKKVRVLQMPVTERVYAQWLNTNLISHQAPDICLMGMSAMVNNEQYMARYFVPLTGIISQPNPYNKGTDLEKVAWRETFFDGMRGQYNTRLQDYFGVPTAAYNIRIFYNKDMFKAATGTDEAPKTFGELMEVCGKISAMGEREDRLIIPIAGSQYSIGMFQDRYSAAFTSGLEPILDVDLDGTISQQEVYIGLADGKIGMSTPQIEAFHRCLRRLCQEFGRGFAGKDRQTAAFEFVQERSAMICTGSWDAASLFLQAEEVGFEVGLFDFPLPAKDEDFGQWVNGKATEAASGAAGAYGLYKFSRNFDQALDFLHYITSREINQIHMTKAEWIPVVLGTEPTGRMAPFTPDPIGFTGRTNMFYGGDVQTRYNGLLRTFLQGGITYEDLASQIEEAMRSPAYGGDRAWTLEWDDLVKQVRNQERMLASQLIRGMMLGAQDAAEKHRQVLLQQVRTNNAENMRHRFREVRGFELPEK